MFKDGANDTGVCFTEAEALGLLDMIMLSPTDLTPEQRDAMLKLSEFCRQYLRIESEAFAGPIASGGRTGQQSQCAA